MLNGGGGKVLMVIMDEKKKGEEREDGWRLVYTRTQLYMLMAQSVHAKLSTEHMKGVWPLS